MKKRLQGLVAGVLIGALSTGSVAFAKVGTEFIEAVYANVKIYIDGTLIDPKDVNGNKVEPFIYNGTTYLPVRAVGEAFGKAVSYDGQTKSVYVGKIPEKKAFLIDVCPPYQTDGYYAEKSYSLAGDRYINGFHLNDDWGGIAYYNMKGKYNKLSFDVGHIDGKPMETGYYYFYLDGELVYTLELEPSMLVEHVEIPLNGANQMVIEGGNWCHCFALVNVAVGS